MSSGLTREDAQGFMQDGVTTQQFAAFFRLLATATGDDPVGEAVKARTDLLLVGLHGVMHCPITIPDHPWTSHTALIGSFA